MLHDIQYYFWDGSLRSLLSACAAFLSVVAALYSTLLLRRMTLRNHGLDKAFNAEIGPWMKDARFNYAKEQSTKSEKKTRKPARSSPDAPN
jgi:hypothetical protein